MKNKFMGFVVALLFSSPMAVFADSDFAYKASEMLPVGIIAAILVLIIYPIVIFVKYKFKSTPNANQYLENDSVVYHQRIDRFVREETTSYTIKSDDD